MANKKFTEADFMEFFASFQDKAMSDAELKKYSKIFTKYLGVLEENAKDYSSITDADLKRSRKLKVHDVMKKVFWRSMIVTAVEVLIGLCGAAALIIWMIKALSSPETSSMLMPGYAVAICMLGIATFIATFFSVKELVPTYLKYKNLTNISVGETYLFDVEGVSCATDYNIKYRPYNSDDGSKLIKRTPLFVQVVRITESEIHFIDIKSLLCFSLPIEKSYLLTPSTNLDDNNFNLVIRYPIAFPSFSKEDIKVIEAALILAKKNNYAKLSEEIENLGAKIFFYNENPYGESFESYKEDMNQRTGCILNSINDLNNLFQKRVKDDDDDDFDEFFNDGDDDN